MSPGIWQILVIVLIVLLLFGGRRIPTIMEDVAKGIKGFKKGLKDDDDGQAKPKAVEMDDSAAQKKE